MSVTAKASHLTSACAFFCFFCLHIIFFFFFSCARVWDWIGAAEQEGGTDWRFWQLKVLAKVTWESGKFDWVGNNEISHSHNKKSKLSRSKKICTTRDEQLSILGRWIQFWGVIDFTCRGVFGIPWIHNRASVTKLYCLWGPCLFRAMAYDHSQKFKFSKELKDISLFATLTDWQLYTVPFIPRKKYGITRGKSSCKARIFEKYIFFWFFYFNLKKVSCSKSIHAYVAINHFWICNLG